MKEAVVKIRSKDSDKFEGFLKDLQDGLMLIVSFKEESFLHLNQTSMENS